MARRQRLVDGLRTAWTHRKPASLTAIQDQEIVGVLGIEADSEIGRAWIYGPLVRHPQWMAVADQLYVAALPAIPPGIHQQQLFCDGRN